MDNIIKGEISSFFGNLYKLFISSRTNNFFDSKTQNDINFLSMLYNNLDTKYNQYTNWTNISSCGNNLSNSTNWNIGIARSKYYENYELNTKWKFASQRRNNSTPLTATLYFVTTYSGKDNFAYTFDIPSEQAALNRRFSFVSQLILSRKFSDRLSFEISPIYIHRNFVEQQDQNESFAVGTGGRFRITKRMSVIADYVFNFGEYRKINNKNGIYNPLGLGLEFETGGHVFSLMFSNAAAINETQFVTNTVDTWTKGGTRFCFTISRIFNLGKKKKH
jgi:hypothetical protein